MMAFLSGLVLACLIAAAGYWAFDDQSISAVEYRNDRSVHVEEQRTTMEMGHSTRSALATHDRVGQAEE